MIKYFMGKREGDYDNIIGNLSYIQQNYYRLMGEISLHFKAANPHLSLLYFFEDVPLFCIAQDRHLCFLIIHKARDGEIVHQHIVKGFMMRVEHHHQQVCTLHKRRSKRGASLLDGDVVVLAIVAGQGGSSGALSLDGVIRVGVDDVHVVQSCPFAVFLEFQGSGPGEGKWVADHVAIGNRADHAVSDLLASDGVSHLLSKANTHEEEKNDDLHSYLINNSIINQAITNHFVYH